MGKRIAIVGAGAKAAAIVARAACLRDLGSKCVPEILVFEAEHVGAAWTGRSGFSSGFLTLCTPGEKDVGFPYVEVSPFGSVQAPVSPEMFRRFSWAVFLAETGRTSEWVERGRNHPNHLTWAEYLDWVFERAGQPVTSAKVTEVRPTESDWEVVFQEHGAGPQVARVDGVVLTGTGRSKAVQCKPGMPAGRACDAESFWSIRDQFLQLRRGKIIVVGDGGAAGAIVGWLAERLAEHPVDIISVSPMGTLFPRGDGYAERRWFSDPSDWPTLSLSDRRTLIDRTEAGVVSLRNKETIDEAPRVGYVWGRAIQAEWIDPEVVVEIVYDGQFMPNEAGDYLISAIGFDRWSLLDLVKVPAAQALRAASAEKLRASVEETIMPDLTLPGISGVPAGLHIPALADLARGPGMSNLGCLGLMAKAVLSRY